LQGQVEAPAICRDDAWAGIAVCPAGIVHVIGKVIDRTGKEEYPAPDSAGKPVSAFSKSGDIKNRVLVTSRLNCFFDRYNSRSLRRRQRQRGGPGIPEAVLPAKLP
jgi:hypothetical protein